MFVDKLMQDKKKKREFAELKINGDRIDFFTLAIMKDLSYKVKVHFKNLKSCYIIYNENGEFYIKRNGKNWKFDNVGIAKIKEYLENI